MPMFLLQFDPSTIYLTLVVMVILAVYLLYLKLKLEEILKEFNENEERVSNAISQKVKLLIKLRGIVEPYSDRKLNSKFKKLAILLDDLMRWDLKTQIEKLKEVDRLTEEIIESSKNIKEIMTNEEFSNFLDEFRVLNTKLENTSYIYLESLKELERIRDSFPFSIFPFPKWRY